MRTLNFICKCTVKDDAMRLARLMQKLGITWRYGEPFTANTAKWRTESTTYYIHNGSIQYGDDYDFVKRYAKRRNCHHEIYGILIKENISVAFIKTYLYHEI